MALTSYSYCPFLLFESKSLEEKIREDLSRHPPSISSISLGKLYKKELSIGYEIPSEVKYISKKVGFGLFATSKVIKGSFVGSYTGVVKVHDPYSSFNDYLYAYPTFSTSSPLYSIDAEKHGNYTRFINHSFDPNLSKHFVYHAGLCHVIFVALREIDPSEQLFYDYGKSYWHLRGAPATI